MSEYEVDPLTGDPLPKTNGQQQTATEPEAITDAQALSWLSTLPEDAKPLARRLLCQCGAVAFMTPKETAQAIIDQLAAIVLVRASNSEQKALRDVISAANSWLDRVEGRPKQTIDANVNVGIVQLFQQVQESRDRLIEGD